MNPKNKVLMVGMMLVSNLLFASSELSTTLQLGTTFDDNIFKTNQSSNFSEGQELSKRSDQIVNTQFGLNYALSYSKQSLLAQLSLGESNYASNSQLNNTSQNVGLSWVHGVGKKYQGTLSLKHSVSLKEFAETEIKQKNEIMADAIAYSGNYPLNEELSVGFRINQRMQENSLAVLKNLDNESLTLGVDLTYQVGADFRINLAYTSLDYKYVRNEGGASNYNQSTLSTALTWTLSPKTNLSFSVGAVSRPSETGDPGYDALNYSLGLNYSITAKSSLSMRGFQTTNEVDNEISSYTETQGFTIAYTYNMNNKFSVVINTGMIKSTSDQVLIGEPGVYQSDLVQTGIALSYQLYENLSLRMNYRYAEKVSDRILENYQSNVYQINIIASF